MLQRNTDGRKVQVSFCDMLLLPPHENTPGIRQPESPVKTGERIPGVVHEPLWVQEPDYYLISIHLIYPRSFTTYSRAPCKRNPWGRGFGGNPKGTTPEPRGGVAGPASRESGEAWPWQHAGTTSRLFCTFPFLWIHCHEGKVR